MSVLLHAVEVGYPGARSRTTDVWLLPADEDRFGEVVAALLPEARWRCSHPGPVGRHPEHVHDTLADAMDCGGVQSFLDLPAGSDPFGGESSAVVQLLRSIVRDDEDGRYFRGGRLATRWYENEVGPDLHLLLASQRDLVWQALRRTTSPAHLQTSDDRPVSGKRIGPDALAVARSESLLLGPMAGWLRYRLMASPAAASADRQ